MGHRRDEGTSRESDTALERPSVRAADDGAGTIAPGAVLAGRYEVRRPIGRGGMGVVVEAFDRVLGVVVAIKIVRAEYAGEREWSERLAREVKLARQIQHPNVCRVFDFAQTDGRAFLIMELATGGTLRDELRSATARARPLTDRISDARALAAGLAAIHAAGIVHRDISPQNALRMGDGRLVLSDFGLATDSFDGSTSIHGGTVAYMAPEVLRGGRANVAADLWALGAVIHEVVFGERLQWNAQAAEMRSSVAGRRLSPLERSVFEICRACLAVDPARRPQGAADIAARLSDVGLARVAGRRARRRAGMAVAVAGVAVLALVGAKRIEASRKRPAPAAAARPADPLMIVPTGEPEDWTDKAKVLAEVPEKIRCMVALPDHHTVRFVWGYPPHAEDVDTRTGDRTPSRLVPDAYAEGCPDLSFDGKRLLYAGHTGDDRAFAFVSEHTDGRNAVPVVQIGEPGANSDPVWLSNGEAFVYDVDDKHVAAFSMTTKRSLIMPTATASIMTSFHAAIGNSVFVISPGRDRAGTEVVGFEYPSLTEVLRWRMSYWSVNVSSPDGRRYYTSGFGEREGAFFDIEPSQSRAHVLGVIPSQVLSHPVFVGDALAMTSAKRAATLVLRPTGKEPLRVPVADNLVAASRCGKGIIATQFKQGGYNLVWMDELGRTSKPAWKIDRLTDGLCSSDGKVMFYASLGERPGIHRCEGGSCRTIFSGASIALALSTDGRRLAFVAFDNGARVATWIPTDSVGPVHAIADAETGCVPVWSSAKDIWVSLRKGRKVIWTEIDTDSRRPTGRSTPGRRDCTDGFDDPDRPLHDPVELEFHQTYQLRMLPAKYLPAAVVSR